MTKKAEVILELNGAEIDGFFSKTLTKRLNKLPPGTQIQIFIKEDKFGKQYVGPYEVKGLSNEPEVPPDTSCAPGMHYDEVAGKCVPDAIDCPPGQHFDEDQRKCVDDGVTPPDHTCPQGQHWDDAQGKCVPDVVTPPDTGEGEVDANGIKWMRARGKITKVPQSRDQANDDRWSENVSGLGLGYEATMIAKSINTSSGAHFASKLLGGNHSGDGADEQRWYDLGIRDNGDVQLQWEGPHPDNHTFTLPSDKLFMKNIGVKLEGNPIGLKWCVEKVNGKQDGSPQNGGVRVRMWADKDPLDANGKPKNNWQLVCDFIDGQDGIEVIKPQSFSAPDEIDIEVRRSNTKTHEVYGGGQFVRALA